MTSSLVIMDGQKRFSLIKANPLRIGYSRELCLMAEIQKIRTTAYHPQGNGACERFNRTLINMIGTLNQKKKAIWQSVVSTLALAYNSTISAATGYSPYFLMYGRLPKLPIDVEYNVAYEKDAKSHHKYVERLEKRLRWAYDKAQSYIEKETKSPQKVLRQKVLMCNLEARRSCTSAGTCLWGRS